MDVRYEVFISSTFEDLNEERRELIEATINLGHIPIGMELFNAADESQWDVIKRRISECDYYVVVISDRYGSIDKDRIGFTEKEYDFAIASGKPVIGFVRSDDAIKTLPYEQRESDNKDKLIDFRNKISARLYKKWSNKDDLAKVYYSSFAALIADKPQTGWVRRGSLVSENLQQQYVDVMNREAKLREIKNTLEEEIKILTKEIDKQKNESNDVEMFIALLHKTSINTDNEEYSLAELLLTMSDFLVTRTQVSEIVNETNIYLGYRYLPNENKISNKLRKFIGFLIKNGLLEIALHSTSFENSAIKPLPLMFRVVKILQQNKASASIIIAAEKL